MTIRTNAVQLSGDLLAKFKNMNAAVNDKLIRTIAESSLQKVKHRVHSEGKKADDSQIGTYKNPYLKLREKKYNRLPDTKIIFSLTGNMENQFVVIATAKGWGLGWLDNLNPKKAEGLQFGNKTLKGFGIVYNLTKEEGEAIQPTIKEFVTEHLK